MVQRLTLVLAVLALAPPAAATADWEPATQVPAVAHWLSVSEQAWPSSPCNGREQVRVVDAAEINDDWGLAQVDGSCRFSIAMQATTDPLAACVTVVHETGHLAGLDHSLDPYNVMYAGGDSAHDGEWPPCVIAAGLQAKVARAEIEQVVRWSPDHCTVLAPSRVLCTVGVMLHSLVHVARYEVSVVGERWEVQRVRVAARRTTKARHA